jgi:acetylornithine/succinyldiaminopimelate/putrescine aminotransferase
MSEFEADLAKYGITVDKAAVLDKSIRWWNPGKTKSWQESGVDLVIGKREGYCLYDVSGRRLIDLHLNGGTYNLGHRNPEVIAALQEGLKHFDMGNHHFPSIVRAELAEMLADATPEGLVYSIFASGGGEAIDIALKCARNATQRKKIISIAGCYHGHTGLALPTGDDRFSKLFLSEGNPNEFVHVPFNDLEAMERALAPGDAACVIMETVPATYGFPIPRAGYLKLVKTLCEKQGTLYIADEVQTGLMRSGELWGIQTYGVNPDILVTAKGLSGGIYPIGAVVVNERAGQWMKQDGFGHISTFGGAELGCLVAMKVLEISRRAETQQNVHFLANYVRQKLDNIQSRYADFFSGIRQLGVIFGLEFNHPEGAKYVMRALYENGVWAIFSMLDPRVLQFKVGILFDQTLCDDMLERVEEGIFQAHQRVSKDHY